MTLIKCPECGKELRIKTNCCPKCNDPFMSKSCGASSTMIIIVIAIVVVFGLVALTCAGL